MWDGRGRIRTYVENLQQIYSMSLLTTRPLSPKINKKLFNVAHASARDKASLAIGKERLKEANFLRPGIFHVESLLGYSVVHKTLQRQENWCADSQSISTIVGRIAEGSTCIE